MTYTKSNGILGEDEGTTQHTAVSAWLYLAQQ